MATEAVVLWSFWKRKEATSSISLSMLEVAMGWCKRVALGLGHEGGLGTGARGWPGAGKQAGGGGDNEH